MTRVPPLQGGAAEPALLRTRHDATGRPDSFLACAACAPRVEAAAEAQHEAAEALHEAAAQAQESPAAPRPPLQLGRHSAAMRLALLRQECGPCGAVEPLRSWAQDAPQPLPAVTAAAAVSEDAGRERGTSQLGEAADPFSDPHCRDHSSWDPPALEQQLLPAPVFAPSLGALPASEQDAGYDSSPPDSPGLSPPDSPGLSPVQRRKADPPRAAAWRDGASEATALLQRIEQAPWYRDAAALHQSAAPQKAQGLPSEAALPSGLGGTAHLFAVAAPRDAAALGGQEEAWWMRGGGRVVQSGVGEVGQCDDIYRGWSLSLALSSGPLHSPSSSAVDIDQRAGSRSWWVPPEVESARRRC